MYEIEFLGACGTVTGSRFLLKVWNKNILIDCGLFQGDRETKQFNWQAFPLPLDKLHGIILTHAHIDHSGWLPRLHKLGYDGPIWVTPGTGALLQIMLPDSGELQEEEARFAEKKGYSPYKPALPLYTEEDAKKTLKQLVRVPFHEVVEIVPGLTFSYRHAGHILGSAFVEIRLKRKGGEHHRWIFSGDVGRPVHPILKPPEPLPKADFLIVESTYGDRLHGEDDIAGRLAEVINRTSKRGGILIIPAFAVDRTQELLVFLSDLFQEGRIPASMPVYLDSPMALNALNFYKQFHAEYSEAFAAKIKQGPNPFELENLLPIRSVEQSKGLNSLKGQAILISASGMCNGGRIEHHLKFKLPDAKNTILFVGYQAAGTKGRLILDGAKEIMIHGEPIPVKAEVASISGLSAHADYEELLAWMAPQPRIPDVFIVHGEDEARSAFQATLKERLGWDSTLPRPGQTIRV
jgi:metallo-beta-lactamase family protein